MLSSKDRILTTHAGSLSRPANLIALSKSIDVGEAKGNDPAYAQVLTASVADVVKKQRELGVDIRADVRIFASRKPGRCGTRNPA